MAETLVEKLLPDIEDVARKVASDYPDVDWQDVRGELSLFVIEQGEYIKTKEDGGNPKWILREVAQQVCRKERSWQNHVSPQYSYRPSDVRKMLETAWSVEELENTYVPEDAESYKKGNDALDIASDIRLAYNKLPEEYKISIFKRYALGEVPDNASYERKKLNKSVNELTKIVNSYKGKAEPRFRRKALSNSTATAIISKGY
jgi:hypothetical protein